MNKKNKVIDELDPSTELCKLLKKIPKKIYILLYES